MSDYTPTTEQLREAWASRYDGEHAYADYEEKSGYWREFDRWLAEHDAEVVARTLAASSTGGVCQVFDVDLEWRWWVKDAEALIKGENNA